MPRKYTNDFKKKTCELIIIKNNSTSKIANELNIPLKTVEKWITSYNKNRYCFDDEYKKLLKRIEELEEENKKLKEEKEIFLKVQKLFDIK